MIRFNNRFIILIIFLLFLAFCYGFVSHRNKIFPYKIIKKTIGSLSGKQLDITQDIKIREKYKNWNDINNNFKPFKEIFLKEYIPGINIYSDRHYFNHMNDDKLYDFSVIQLPKHYGQNIQLYSSSEVTIYRALCDHNNNNEYDNWEKVDFEIMVISHTCIYKDLVKKSFIKGKIVLSPGGPKSSDPIFISSGKLDLDLKILDIPPEIFLVPAYKLQRE